jgi:hypothetical protein
LIQPIDGLRADPETRTTRILRPFLTSQSSGNSRELTTPKSNKNATLSTMVGVGIAVILLFHLSQSCAFVSQVVEIDGSILRRADDTSVTFSSFYDYYGRAPTQTFTADVLLLSQSSIDFQRCTMTDIDGPNVKGV